jgi:hypothetical protein
VTWRDARIILFTVAIALVALATLDTGCLTDERSITEPR